MDRLFRLSLPAVGVVFCLTQVSCTKEVAEVAGCNFPNNSARTLIFEEDFETFDTLNTWNFVVGNCVDTTVSIFGMDTVGECFWDDREQQLFTSRVENAKVDSGKLILTGRFENPLFEGNRFTSARLTTQSNFSIREGRIEVRAIVPSGEGLWPSVYLSPVVDANNIFDLAELGVLKGNGLNTSQVLSYIEFADTSGSTALIENQFSYATTDSVDFSKDYHVYSMQWNNDCVQFFVDSTEVDVPTTRSSVLPNSWTLNQEYYVVVDLALGGNGGGNVPFQTLNPSNNEESFIIDYIKVYQ